MRLWGGRRAFRAPSPSTSLKRGTCERRAGRVGAPQDAPRGAVGAFAACWSKARASHRALSPRWSSWFFHLHSPDSQTHRGFKHLQAAAGVVVMLISPIWFIKRAVVQIFQYYLTFPSSQDFVFELQCVQEVSDNLRHLMLGCSANYTDVANNM